MLIVILVVLLIFFVMCCYVKAPPDKAFIVSGLRKKPRVVIGRATIRIPFLERLDSLPLTLLQVDIKTNSAVPTSEYINIFIDGVANIKISARPELLSLAMQNFLKRSKQEIGSVAQEVLEGNMREIVGQMQLSDLVQNRDKFAEMVQQNARDDMEKMGLEIVNLTIQNFVDEHNAINDLGVDNLTNIQKHASIAKANSERDIAIAASMAREEANKARINSEMEIARQENDLVMRRADLQVDADIKKARADVAYEIQKEEERKRIEIAKVDADIARKEREIELQDKELNLNEKRLTVEIKQQAEAQKFEQQLIADAKRYEREQEALGIEAVGHAEAKAIREKAEAMKEMGEASIIEMYLQIMPSIMEQTAKPLSNVDKITMYGEGNVTKLMEDVVKSSNQVMNGLGEATGIDLKTILNNLISSSMNKNFVNEVETFEFKQDDKETSE